MTAQHTGLVAQTDSPALTKADLSELIFNNVGLSKRESKELVELFFEEIRFALEREETVKLSNFGTFHIRDKAARPGRNPKTGEEVAISARRVVTFHPSQKLREKVDGTPTTND